MSEAGHGSERGGEVGGVGRRHHLAKLTWEQVREIRASSESDRALARRFGVSRPTVRLVRLNQTWVDPSYTPRAAFSRES